MTKARKLIKPAKLAKHICYGADWVSQICAAQEHEHYFAFQIFCGNWVSPVYIWGCDCWTVASMPSLPALSNQLLLPLTGSSKTASPPKLNGKRPPQVTATAVQSYTGSWKHPGNRENPECAIFQRCCIILSFGHPTLVFSCSELFTLGFTKTDLSFYIFTRSNAQCHISPSKLLQHDWRSIQQLYGTICCTSVAQSKTTTHVRAHWHSKMCCCYFSSVT